MTRGIVGIVRYHVSSAMYSLWGARNNQFAVDDMAAVWKLYSDLRPTERQMKCRIAFFVAGVVVVVRDCGAVETANRLLSVLCTLPHCVSNALLYPTKPITIYIYGSYME